MNDAVTVPATRLGLPELSWTTWPTPFVLFTGKGGVGKTTIAAAAAVALADAGQRVLLVSTDPASNLADVLGTTTGNAEPMPVTGVRGLDVLDLDPQAAANAYREQALARYRDALPSAELKSFAEQLAGACTVEVAAFDAFARLLTDTGIRDRYDRVVFDTAPTGHTLRLLALPAAWSTYLADAPDATTCLGPLADMDAKRVGYTDAVAALADGAVTTVVLVARPDRGALTEAARAAAELADLGITRQQLVVNAVLAEPLPGDDVASAYAGAQRQALAALPPGLAGLHTAHLPLRGADLTGVAAIRALARPASGTKSPPASSRPPSELPGFDALVDDLAAGDARAILVTGKGGVGKTTIATRIAVALAERGLPVHLSTTDPAGRLPERGDDVPPCLTVSRIDPAAETAKYVAAKLDAGRDLDPHRRDLLEEELRSPCTAELAVFRAFSSLLTLSRKQFVVIDTAPSGHTLLLLDLTGAYHRQALASLGDQARRATTPLMRLQDPTATRLLLVTLPETTPVAEAAEVQDDLRRAGVEPFGWVVNASLAAAGTRDPLLARRAALEEPHVRRVRDELASRAWLVPWTPTDRAAPAAISAETEHTPSDPAALTR